MPMLSAYHRPTVLAVLCCTPLLPAQATPEKPASDQTALLLAARSRYYNLRNAGVKSFHCDVQVHWPAFFASLGQTVPDDNPVLTTLRAAKISVTNQLDAGPKADWLDAAPPTPALQASIAQMRDGMKQMLEGFFTSWNPTWSGKMITMWPASFKPTPAGGYLLDDSGPGVKDFITFDKDLRVTHLSSNSAALGFEGDTLFEPSEHGLVMTSLDADYRQPATAPATHLTMKASFQPVGQFTLPATVSVSIPNTLRMTLRFTGCTVQAADTEASLREKPAAPKPVQQISDPSPDLTSYVSRL